MRWDGLNWKNKTEKQINSLNQLKQIRNSLEKVSTNFQFCLWILYTFFDILRFFNNFKCWYLLIDLTFFNLLCSYIAWCLFVKWFFLLSYYQFQANVVFFKYWLSDVFKVWQYWPKMGWQNFLFQYLKRHVMEEPSGEQSHWGYLWEQSTELNNAWAD